MISRRALFLFVLSPFVVLAAATHIALPSGDDLWLAIPAAWDQKFEAPDSKTPPSVRLLQHQGATFNVYITPLPASKMGEVTQNKLRAIVTSASSDALAQSVEMTIAVHELNGTDVQGFYFSATDRAPKPGEWKYMTQGMVTIDGSPFAFTILTNDGQEEIAKTALELIRTASLHARTST